MEDARWETGDMKGTDIALIRRPLIATAVLLSILALSDTPVGATSTTTTQAPSTQLTCGVVKSPAVHFVSKGSPCVIRVRVGTNVRIKLRSGFRWGYPVSNSRAVVVTQISLSSRGVNGATLHAASNGHATIHVTGTVSCKPGVACPNLALLWSLKVVVS
jgi:hypothetical protein